MADPLPDPAAPALSDTSVSSNPLYRSLRDIAPRPLAAPLARLGLHRFIDLLFYFPRDYEDFTRLADPGDWEVGQPIAVAGRVVEASTRPISRGRTITNMIVQVGPVRVRCTWFNQPFRAGRHARGDEVVVRGKLRRKLGVWEFHHPQLVPFDPQTEAASSTLQPVYRLTRGIKQHDLRRLVRTVLDACLGTLEEVLPAAWRAARDLVSIDEAVAGVHFPRDRSQAERSRLRFVYQELFTLQLAMGLRRARLARAARAPALAVDARIDARIRRLFPFDLTGDQRRAIGEIARDLSRNVPMARLLQGDVGSGKTVVAQYAMLLAVAHGYQTVLMAPTEVLARQHARTLFSNLRASRVRKALLVGSLAASEREEVRRKLAAGELDLVIGTHAICQEGVRFSKLGLVVIDEQHRFGVWQRARLQRDERQPHYLVMTATPIPRTVALALYGDLDVSLLREFPPGRQPVRTYWVSERRRDAWWQFVRRKLAQGRQAIVVAPRIESDAETGLHGAAQLARRLQQTTFAGFRVGLLHGQLPAAEKDRVMVAFAQGGIHVLVATSVVEVGIDVPNAVTLTVEHAEQFGLAQLHQLRGRVGRGSHPGFVALFAQPATEAARERIEALIGTGDGFELAEVDFRLRGPGELLGTRQHGQTPLRIADLARDEDVLAQARRDARRVLADDPMLDGSDWRPLRARIERRFQDLLLLADTG